MVRAEIVAAAFPSEATPGESVHYQITLRNVGDEAGHLICSIAYYAEGAWQPTLGDWFILDPGQGHIWDLYLTMPDHDIDVIIDASHWDPVAVQAVTDEQRGPYTLAVIGPLIPKPGEIHIVDHQVVESAQAGASVAVRVTLQNVGGEPAIGRLELRLLTHTYSQTLYSPSMLLQGHQAGDISRYFYMPDFDVRVILFGQTQDGAYAGWEYTGETRSYLITVVRDPWPAVGMPQYLWNFLSGGWCNVLEGQWVSVTILGVGLSVPLWSFTPGIYARDAIQWTIDVVNTMRGGLGEISVAIQEAWDKAWEAANAIGDWLAGADSWLTTQVGNWWSATWPSIQEFITVQLDNLNIDLTGVWSSITGLNDWLSNLQADYQDFKSSILGDILNLDVFQVLKDGYNSFQEFRDNPLDWIYDRVWDFFDWGFIKMYDWLMEEVE